MKGKIIWGLVAAPILALSIPNYLSGQVYYSTLVGTVRDASGAVVPNAEVIATEVSKNEKFPTHTDATGDYKIENLRPGQYTVEAATTGFKRKVVSEVTLVVGLATRVDMSLEVGQTSQTVEVSGKTPVLQTESGVRQGLMQSTEIQEMPLLGRNVMNLALNIPGMVTNQAVQLPYGVSGDPGLRANGMAEYNAQYRVDGGYLLNQFYGGEVEQIVPDAIQEIKVETGNFTAENGQHAGALIVVATKSGTNHFHGDVWEYVQNDKLNAETDQLGSTLTKPPVRYNQFGGVIGGPIVKNKLFFFGSYEGVRNLSPQAFHSEVPTAAEKQGNFSGASPTICPSPPCAFNTIYDPNGVDPVTGNRDVFSGNVIPMARFDKVSSNYLALPAWPDPNQSGIPNFSYNGAAKSNFNRYSARIDWNPSSKDILYGRYGHQTNPSLAPGTIPGPGTFRSGENAGGADLVVGWTHTFGATKFNELRVSMANFYKDYGQGGFSSPNEAVNLGFAFGSTLQGVSQGCPEVYFPGYGGTQLVTACQASFGWIAPAKTYYLTDDFTFIHGKHTFKTGFFTMYYWNNFRIGFSGGGGYGFSGLYTAATGDTSGGTGNPFADFLLGAQNGLSYTDNGTFSNDRKKHFDGYFQDDWKVSSKLTLQLGLRYTFASPLYTADGENSAYIANVGSVGTPLHRTGAMQVYAANSKALVLKAIGSGTLGIPYEFESSNFLTLPHYTDFAPRFGFAYRLGSDNRSVIRGGYGIFNSYSLFSGDQPGNSRPFFGAASTPPNPVPSDVGPIPYYMGQTPGPPLLTFPPGTLISGGYQSDPNGTRSGISQEWNLTYQRALSTNWALEIGYVGNYSTRLAQLQPSNLTYMPGFTFHYGDGTTYTVNTTDPITDAKPWPEISGGLGFSSTGLGKYEAAEFSLVKNMSHGLQMRLGYTRSSALGQEGEANNFGTMLQNEFDHTMIPTEAYTPNIFYATYVYQLPGRNLHGFVGQVAGGWMTGGIIHIQTGARSYLRELFPQWPGAPSGVIAPHLACDPNANAPHTTHQWFNTSCVVQPAVNQFGDDKAITGIVDDPMRNWDFNVYKYFKTFEGQRLEIGAEFFNAFNHPLLGRPDGYRGDAGFGIITSAGPGRQIQLVGKYEF